MNDDRRQAGWFSTLAALVVLVGVGFLCGAVAGFLWEEPGLVLAYLSGKTEPVKWSNTEPGPVAAEPPSSSASAELGSEAAAKVDADVEIRPPAVPVVLPAAASAVAPRADEPVHERPAASARAKTAEKNALVPAHTAAAGKPAAAVIAAVNPSGRFSIQVGAFADRASADKLASHLRARGYGSFVKADAEAGAKRFRVRVGPVKARARAEELAAKLAKGEKLPTWILDESKG